MDLASIVKGSEKLTQIFNRWPSFHDSEVVSFHLDREGEGAPSLTMKVHLFEGVQELGRITWKNHTIASLKFTTVVEVEFDGFNNQNAIFDLTIEPVAAGHEGVTWTGPAYQVEISTSYGLGGSFICGSIEVVDVEGRCPPGVYS